MIERVINSRASFRRNPDVNSQGQIDEDGDGAEVGSSNSAVNDLSAVAADEGEEDDSPSVHSVTVMHTGKLTDISVRVVTSEGAVNKRLVLPGHLTMKRLTTALLNVRNW